MVLNGDVTEFSIFDWSQVIKSLLTVSTSLDSSVVISMLMDGQDIFKLTIRRFENEITAYWEDGIVELDISLLNKLSIDELENIYISSLFLKQPEQSDDKLLALSSEGVLSGRWAFSPETRASGPWLIYPHIDSKLQFRPLLWNVGNTLKINEEDEDILGIDTLAKAIVVFNPNLRNKAILQVLNLMAGDLEHKSWGYLNNLWEKCEHLPMSTFDIWKLAIHETQFLACLLINGHEQIVNHLVEEFPLIWELVKYSDWEQSILLYKKKMFSHLDEDDADDIELTAKLILKKISVIELQSESMISHGKILKLDFLDQQSQDLLIMKGPAQIVLQPIIEDEVQNLLQRPKENAWPTYLSNSILQKCEALPNEYLSFYSSCLASVPISEEHSFRQSVILLPMLLAWRSLSNGLYEDWPCDAGEMFKLQQIISFDEDWFIVIYKLLTAWLSQQPGLMENN